MKASGVLIVLLGVWAGCQVFGGDALHRLKMLPPATA